VYGSGGSDKADLLAACYFNSLSLAASHKLKSIAFPAISTGIYGYPLAEAAAVSSRTIEQFLSVDGSIDTVHLVFFAADDARVFLQHQAFSG
jgi:O-acetyl-ADP-ribose deacetylase (regulator of RNase III)